MKTRAPHQEKSRLFARLTTRQTGKACCTALARTSARHLSAAPSKRATLPPHHYLRARVCASMFAHTIAQEERWASSMAKKKEKKEGNASLRARCTLWRTLAATKKKNSKKRRAPPRICAPGAAHRGINTAAAIYHQRARNRRHNCASSLRSAASYAKWHQAAAAQAAI